MSNGYKILVVDDEEDLCEILKFNLELEGYDVDTAFSAEEALKMDLEKYHLLMLDVMMGEISGFQMAKKVRENKKLDSTPIMFLTAKDTENDMIYGLNIGADDYISKPYSIREVIARIKAIIRRSGNTNNLPHIITYKNLKMDISKKKTFILNEEIALTKKEFEI